MNITAGTVDSLELGWHIPLDGGREVSYPTRNATVIENIPYRDGYIELPNSSRGKRTLTYVLEQTFCSQDAAEEATDTLLAAFDIKAGELTDGLSGKTFQNVSLRSADVDTSEWCKRRVTLQYDADPYVKRSKL